MDIDTLVHFLSQYQNSAGCDCQGDFNFCTGCTDRREAKEHIELELKCFIKETIKELM